MPQRVKVTTDDGQSVIVTLADDEGGPPQSLMERIQDATSNPPSSKGVALPLVSGSMPALQRITEEVATNPNAWKGGRDLGQLLGFGAGLMKGGPVGAGVGMYAGGKAGWRVANAAQRLAAPIAGGLEKIAPAAEAVSQSPFGSMLQLMNPLQPIPVKMR